MLQVSGNKQSPEYSRQTRIHTTAVASCSVPLLGIEQDTLLSIALPVLLHCDSVHATAVLR
jgi:hypothetical protein